MEVDRLFGLVLAGGASSRMGLDKALAEVREGVPQLDWSLNALSPFCRTVWLSVGNEERCEGLGFPIEGAVFDEPEVPGPMAGVIAGLKRASGNGIFVLACDMPYLDAAVLLQLKSRRNPESLATCFVGADGRPEPLCAIYESAALAALEDCVGNEWYSLRRFLEESDTERVTPSQSRWLSSVNTPGEMKEAKSRLRSD